MTPASGTPLPDSLLDRLELVDGHSLPGLAHVDPEVFSWELGALWPSTWICLGHRREIEQGPSQQPMTVADQPVLLTIDRSGDQPTVRGFANICPHRSCELVEPGETVDRRLITCPYHAWSFHLDGSLRATGRAEPPPGFDPAAWGLRPVRLARWLGWWFANLDGSAPEINDHAGALTQILGPYRTASLRSVRTIDYEVAANWKLFAANYHECYHCPTVHPELAALCDVDSDLSDEVADGSWIGGPMALAPSETLAVGGGAVGPSLPGLGERQRRTVWLGQLVPNLFVAAHPDYVLTHLVQPVSADRTHVRCDWLVADPDATHDIDRAVELWDLTNRQDWSIIERIQRVASSPQARPGPLFDNETSVRRYEKTIAHAYRSGRLHRNPNGTR